MSPPEFRSKLGNLANKADEFGVRCGGYVGKIVDAASYLDINKPWKKAVDRGDENIRSLPWKALTLADGALYISAPYAIGEVAKLPNYVVVPASILTTTGLFIYFGLRHG